MTMRNLESTGILEKIFLPNEHSNKHSVQTPRLLVSLTHLTIPVIRLFSFTIHLLIEALNEHSRVYRIIFHGIFKNDVVLCVMVH